MVLQLKTNSTKLKLKTSTFPSDRPFTGRSLGSMDIVMKGGKT